MLDVIIAFFCSGFFLCDVGESENAPSSLGLAVNTLLPDPVVSTAAVAAEPYNGIWETPSAIVLFITITYPLILSFL